MPYISNRSLLYAFHEYIAILYGYAHRVVTANRTDSILNRLVAYFLGYAEVLKLVIYEMNALGILYLVNSFECF